jgi:hypothetical protein
MNVKINNRDYELFDDISRFGFSTVDHFIERFSTTIWKAYRRFNKLSKAHYLSKVAQSRTTQRDIYVPARHFYKYYSFDKVSKWNMRFAAHDEYLLILFSILKNKIWGEYIILESDIKKNKQKASKYLRIPDMIVNHQGGKYYIEYERTLKSYYKFQSMKIAYEKLSQEKHYFVFICENKKIAEKVKEILNINQISFIKPKEFLSLLKTDKYDRFIDYVWDESVNYF